MGRGRAAVTWRRATPADAVALRDLERAANLVALAHVFGEPFPDDGVLARWQETLADPSVTVLMTPVAFTSWDSDGRLRHLAVHPDHWGTGLAREGVELAVSAIRASGRVPRLWVLVDNQRARGLYGHLGWQPTGRTQRAEWPPYPREIELSLTESGHGR
ncbi:MAG TPA: GNAT family N-acetyltransferase [Nocardioides sp.]|uniref:GNAT family N-acetyltransferase n=1 Tax=Nocardioides sp. TaxID=35761 RepID=UPI002E31E551|nr:GNAT family N-acetyltransferase [Nocardioides sp.]HEX5088281.1 GNAT family N-acetyltransferase [Nocardioides sp.]